jgi:SAM-dependent methyltransferase
MNPLPEAYVGSDRYEAIAEQYDEAIGRYSARYAGDLIDLLYPQSGERALDLAGGTGAAGLKLAERIGADGSVTIADISPAALRVAAARAAALGLANVDTRLMDAHRLQFADATFDLLVCCLAAADFVDIDKALAEAFRVLKRGGRAGFSVWSRPDRVPYFASPRLALLRMRGPLLVRTAIGLPVVGGTIRNWWLGRSTPGRLSPLRLWRPGFLEKLLVRAGFGQTRREWRALPLEYSSFNSYWEAFVRGTPMAPDFAGVPDDSLAEIKSELRDQFVNPRTGEVLMWNEAALVLARKPD